MVHDPQKSKHFWLNCSPEITTVNIMGCDLADNFRCISTQQSWIMRLVFVYMWHVFFFFLNKSKTRRSLNMLLCNLLFH